MKRWTAILAVLVMFALFVGCSGGGSSPVLPTSEGDQSMTGSRGASTQTQCWGMYEVAINTTDGTVEITPLRHAMFAANVETFIKTKNIKIALGTIVTDPGGLFMDIPVHVTLIHPFPGLDEYNGFDVRGIFMADGGATVDGLPVAEWGTNNGFLRNADGYTRWWNPSEFTVPGVLGYRPAALTTPKGFTGDAYVNPYCYFADGLGVTDMNPDIGVNESLWDFLQANADTRGLFSAGAQNTRFYDLRFWGSAPWVFFTYAVVACWEEPAVIPPGSLDDFPETANSEEAIACSVEVTPSIYDTGTDKGGNLILDINVWDWSWPSTASGETFEEVQLIVESSVLTAPYAATSGDEVGGGENFSTWHVDIPADNITGATTDEWEEEFWVIVKYPNLDYQNDFGVTQGTGDDPLTAYFRYNLYVHNESYCAPVTVTGIDFDPPNALTKPVATAYTGVEIYGSGFEGTTAIVQFQGTVNIDATNVVSNGNDLITCDVDFTGTSVGDLFDLYVENECGRFTTVPDMVEIDVGIDIVPWDGTPIGGGPFLVTVKGADSTGQDGFGNPVPVHGDYIIDLAVRSNDGGVYIAWAQHKTWDNNKDFGYVDRYTPDLLTVPANIPIFQYGANDPLSFSYRDFQLDCGDAGTTYPNGWGAEFLNAHIATNENMTPDAGYGPTLATWDYWGIAYGNPPYTYGRCVGATSCGTGHVYTYCAKFNGSAGNVVRINGYVPGNGLWDFWQAYLAGQLAYFYVANDTYDDGSQGEVYAVAMGSTPSSVFFGLRNDSPHVVKYASTAATGTTGTGFGIDGTNVGEVKNPIDMSIRETGDRIYVLDEPSTGMTRLQCFDTSGNLLARSEVHDASTNGGSAPYRMDYNEFHDCIYVLYDNNTIEAWIDNSK